MTDLLVQLDKELPTGSEITLFNGRQGIMGKFHPLCTVLCASLQYLRCPFASLASMDL